MSHTCGYCLNSGDGCYVCQEKGTKINEFGEEEFVAPILNDSDTIEIVSIDEVENIEEIEELEIGDENEDTAEFE